MKTSKESADHSTHPATLHRMPFTRVELCVLSVVDGQLSVLLGQRQSDPHAGRWALPGGVLRIDLDQDLDAAVQRVATERLGTLLPYFRQLKAVGCATRDSRAAWALSVAYRALLPPETLEAKAGKRINAIRWMNADAAADDRDLAFDHRELIAEAIRITRLEVEQLELPTGYLPPSFTLGELQSACEGILGRHLDKSSFRRKLNERQLVEEIPGELRTGAFRPAQVFRIRPS
jgi:ADP-ribose pyrophosphatase YjhB (NUDIX family)